MKISTRGRYAVRVMIDLAEHNTGENISLADIAKRQNISEKYLESIVSSLVKSGNLRAVRGKNGGYRLAKDPQDYTIREILEVTEGSFAPVACLEIEPNECAMYSECKTIHMWEGAYQLLKDYFDSISLQSLVENQGDGNNYVI